MCHECKGPVDDGTGYFHISQVAVNKNSQDLKAWDLAHPGPAYDWEEFNDRPGPVPWHVHHEDCDPLDEFDYAIPIQDVRTTRQDRKSVV